MATTAAYHSREHSHPGERREPSLQVKQEPMEDARGHHAMTAMDMSHQLQQQQQQQQPTNGLDPSRHNGTSPPALVYGMDYSPYTSPYDQRAPYPPPSYHHLHQQQHSSPHSHDSHHKQQQQHLNGYPPHTGLPSPLHPANSNTINQQQMMGSADETEDCDDVPVLKIKRSNGKLALPEMLRADGAKGIDMMSLNTHQRAKREFVPDNRKDQGYWTKRVKNNDSARRSRVKRKALEKIMETRLIELQQENIELRHEMNSLKRRFGLQEDAGPAGPTYGGNLNGSLDSVLDGLAPSSPEKLSKEDDLDLEQQSSASDDSRSLDDSRSSYNVRSVSALSQSFEPANRDRADSLGSNGSGSPPAAAWREYNSYVKTDPSGALDLTSDFSARSSSTSSSTSSSQSQSHPNNTTTDFHHHPPHHPHHHSHPPPSNPHTLDTDSSLQYATTHNVVDTKMASGGMRGIPLKCRWKYNSSVNGAPPVDSSA